MYLDCDDEVLMWRKTVPPGGEEGGEAAQQAGVRVHPPSVPPARNQQVSSTQWWGIRDVLSGSDSFLQRL
jgi:hypothetical protein